MLRSVVRGVSCVVLSGVLVAPAFAQQSGPPPVVGGTGVQPLCVTGCGGGGNTYSLVVTPDGTPVTAAQNSTGHVQWFEVANTGTFAASVTLTCSRVGPVTCTAIKNLSGTPVTTVLIDAGEIADIQVVYSTGSAGAATLKLTAAENGASDVGSYAISVQAPPNPIAVVSAPILQNRGGIDRGLCFTAGAGAAAGTSCGDLVVTHAMPAYRTMGRDRTLTLLYNSAAARGRVLVAASAYQPLGSATASKLTAILKVAGLRDSADYAPVPSGSTAQVVMGDRLPYGIATGVYVDTLILRNVYAGTVLETSVIDTVVVVNTGGSDYGLGWGLAGVEHLLFSQPAGTQGILWVGGDGSAIRYSPISSSRWVAAAGEFRDTITYDVSTSVYTRHLKHGVTVTYDYAGQHTGTTDRYGRTTSFEYDVFSWTSGGELHFTFRLGRIGVPGNDGASREYHLYWSFAPGLQLDSISDPGGRKIRLTHLGAELTAITDPDGQQTQFGYAGPDSLLSFRKVPNPAIAGGWAQTTYTYAGRSKLIRMRSPAGPTGTDSTVIKYLPWNVNGLDTLAGGLPSAVIPTSPVAAFPSTVDGPIAGTGDRYSAWVDQFGQPTRTLLEGTGAVTTIYHDSVSMPALVTRLQMPNLRWILLRYNARGNLVMQRDSTWSVDSLPTSVTSWVYGDTSFPDTPTQIADALGRTTIFALHPTFGVPVLMMDPAGHRTSFSYLTSGLLQSTSDSAVETWIQGSGTDSLVTLTTAFEYDGMGQVRKVTAPTGGVTVWQSDSFGQVTAQWSPDSLRTDFYYNRLGQDTTVVRGAAAVANPLGVGSVCRPAEFTCGVHPTAWPTGPAPTTTLRTFRGVVGVDSIVADRGVPRSFRYDASGTPTRELDEDTAHAIHRFVGGSQLLDSTIARSGARVRYQYDAVGRLTQLRYDTVITWAGDVNWTYAWDTMPADTLSYQYDIEGRVLSTSGRWPQSGTVTRTYWANGLLRTKVVTEPFLDSLSYSYDLSGALVQRIHTSYVGGGASTRMQDVTVYTYSGWSGRLTSIATTMIYPTGVQSPTLQFQWDGLGRRRTITYPGSKAVQYRYDAGGVLRAVWTEGTSCDAHDQFCVSLARDSVDMFGKTLSQLTTCAGTVHDGYACGAGPTQRTSSRFYVNGSLASQRTATTSDSIQYDATGNITRQWRQWDGFWHDRIYAPRSNRLTQDTLEHSPSLAPSPLVYRYTADGSRALEYVPGATGSQKTLQRNYRYDGLGRVRGFGDVVSAGDTSHINNYDRNSCRYDAEGRMTRACGAGVDVVYDGENIVGATDGQWHFIDGPGVDDALIGFGQKVAGGSVNVVYWVNDGSGGTLSVSLANGTWDSTLDAVNGDGQGWQQSGGVRNAGTYSPERQGSLMAPQLAFFRNRIYDQATGQWTQEDPAGLAGGLNLYQYAGGNPVMFSDPFGLCPLARDHIPCRAVFIHGAETHNDRLRAALDQIAAEQDRPLYVNSAYRTPEENAAVGGTPGSTHTTDNGADVRLDGMTKEQTAGALNHSQARRASGLRLIYHTPSSPLPEHNHLEFDPQQRSDVREVAPTRDAQGHIVHRNFEPLNP